MHQVRRKEAICNKGRSAAVRVRYTWGNFTNTMPIQTSQHISWGRVVFQYRWVGYIALSVLSYSKWWIGDKSVKWTQAKWIWHRFAFRRLLRWVFECSNEVSVFLAEMGFTLLKQSMTTVRYMFLSSSLLIKSTCVPWIVQVRSKNRKLIRTQ